MTPYPVSFPVRCVGYVNMWAIKRWGQRSIFEADKKRGNSNSIAPDNIGKPQSNTEERLVKTEKCRRRKCIFRKIIGILSDRPDVAGGVEAEEAPDCPDVAGGGAAADVGNGRGHLRGGGQCRIGRGGEKPAGDRAEIPPRPKFKIKKLLARLSIRETAAV